MTFSLVNPSGWTTGDLLTEDQINQLDSDHAKAIDGANGGNYTLNAPLTIAGDVVTIPEGLVAPTISGNTAFQNNISVSGTSTFTDDVSCLDTLSALDLVQFFGGLYLQGASSGLAVDGSTVLNGTTTANANVTLSSGNILSAPTGIFSSSLSALNETVNGKLELSTSNKGRLIFATGQNNIAWNNGSHLLQVGVDQQLLIATDLDAITDVTLTDTGAQSGDFFLIGNLDNTYDLRINNPSSVFLGSIGFSQMALVVRYGAAWYMFKLFT